MPTTSTPGVGWDLSDVTRSDAALRRFLHGLPGVDQVGAEARAAALGTRSIKTTAKEQALDLAIRMVDLTTLEGQDTPGKVRALASKAMRPDPTDPTCPATAAVCVYPDLVGVAKDTLGDSGVNIAAVATDVSGRAEMKLALDPPSPDLQRPSHGWEATIRNHAVNAEQAGFLRSGFTAERFTNFLLATLAGHRILADITRHSATLRTCATSSRTPSEHWSQQPRHRTTCIPAPKRGSGPHQLQLVPMIR